MYFVYDPDSYLLHYGVLERSGRFPWGSGEDPYQRLKSFKNVRSRLIEDGFSEKDLVDAMGFKSINELRSYITYADNMMRLDEVTMARKLRDRSWSHAAIAKELGLAGESTVRALLKPEADAKARRYAQAREDLMKQADAKKMIDVSRGIESQLGMTDDAAKKVLKSLEVEGYHLENVWEPQGTGNTTTVTVLTAPDVTRAELMANRTEVKPYAGELDINIKNGARLGVLPPVQVDKDRIAVAYGDEGGKDRDGIIFVRPGVKDLSLDGKTFAQVRIAADGTHYIKGIAMYSDEVPDGKDLLVFTPKSKDVPVFGDKKASILKPIKDDEDNPFGSVVRQITNEEGTKATSAMNIVNDEDDWTDWSNTLSSQMLSKQSSALAKNQLELTRASKQAKYDRIMELENPEVRKHMLNKVADEADSAARHLQASALPRQRQQVLVPVPSLKDNEVYAPNFETGETLVLIRHPHAGNFEIPTLTVNNNNKEGTKYIGKNNPAAIGINARVAEQLSGADFDGDTVLAIPDNAGRVSARRPLKELEGFDAKEAYPYREGMKLMTKSNTGKQMGAVSNLITDMQIKGASDEELARAVKHSQVVIDAEKHRLDYTLSAQENRIADLKKQYQQGGASTIISLARSPRHEDKRREARVSEGGRLDEEGRVRYVTVPDSELWYTNKKGERVKRTVKTTAMDQATDARTLSSGTPMEEVYATHANTMKALGNKARLSASKTPRSTRNPEAATKYKTEVDELKLGIRQAKASAPRERHAQRYANAIVKAKVDENPAMTNEEKKKARGQAIVTARARLGVKKPRIEPTDRQWEAIQNGAVSSTMIEEILNYGDQDRIVDLATPKEGISLTNAEIARIKSMASRDYTNAEIASVLGVSPSTVSNHL